jgi:hypothetical protein
VGPACHHGGPYRRKALQAGLQEEKEPLGGTICFVFIVGPGMIPALRDVQTLSNFVFVLLEHFVDTLYSIVQYSIVQYSIMCVCEREIFIYTYIYMPLGSF